MFLVTVDAFYQTYFLKDSFLPSELPIFALLGYVYFSLFVFAIITMNFKYNMRLIISIIDIYSEKYGIIFEKK